MSLDSFTARLRAIVESSAFQNTVIAVILVNSATLGLETSPWFKTHYGSVLSLIDRAAIAFFVVELLVKLFVYRLSFFRSAWNIFDFVVVAVTLMPATDNMSILRMLRIVRAFRLISAVTGMRTVIEGLLRALPGMGSIAMLLCLLFYVAAVMATTLFGTEFDAWFGSVGRSAFSLFQIMTLESWSMGIVRPVMELYPYAWLFFVVFILLSSFTVLNLFIAIIVNAVNYVSSHERHDETPIEALTREIAELRSEVRALKVHRGT
ncbi:MAG: ion transporter [Gammaproteobacteria bacterium]|nr:ion transporter [Gammaproteobacteria bacterium]MCY4322990.1 ion transporter [Gammaproteobacteria bacterium]